LQARGLPARREHDRNFGIGSAGVPPAFFVQTHTGLNNQRNSSKLVIPTEASRRRFFAFASCERVGSRSGETLA